MGGGLDLGLHLGVEGQACRVHGDTQEERIFGTVYSLSTAKAEGVQR